MVETWPKDSSPQVVTWPGGRKSFELIQFNSRICHVLTRKPLAPGGNMVDLRDTQSQGAIGKHIKFT